MPHIFDLIRNEEYDDGDYFDANGNLQFNRGRVTLSHIGYNCMLEQLIAELDIALKCDMTSSSCDLEINQMILHPPRILRAIIDYKIELGFQASDTNKIEELVRRAIEVGLHVYSEDRYKAISELKDFYAEIKSRFPDLLQKSVIQEHDQDTYMAMDPILTRRCAHEMTRQLRIESVLFIAIGHGSYANGLDTYLRYCKNSNSQGNVFYAVRYSRLRHRDPNPQLSLTEKSDLLSISQGKEIILFDDVVANNLTLKCAERYFSTEVFPTRRITVFSIYVSRDPLATDPD